MIDSCKQPEPATGDLKLAETENLIADKRQYAARWKFSVRKIDDLLARGLPHLKIGARRVRILIPEADAWMRERFGMQRRGKLATNGQQQGGQ